MRDDRKVAAHRLEQRHAESFVVGERDERGRAAVVGDELLDGHASGEGDRVVESRARYLLTQPCEVLAGHGGRADEVEARGAVGLAVFRERRDDVVDRLLREDLPNGEDGRALILQAARDLGIRRDVELLPVDRDRDDRGVRAASLLELAAVVLAVFESELRAARAPPELLPAELRVRDDRMELMRETESLGHFALGAAALRGWRSPPHRAARYSSTHFLELSQSPFA